MGSNHYKDYKYHVYLGYSQSERGGELRSGEKEGPYACREDAYIDFTPDGLYTQASDSQETIGVDFDPSKYIDKEVFMVVVRYTDGHSFGTTHGYWHITGVYPKASTARRLAKQIKNNKYSDYKPWDGYFASLDSVDIWGTKLRDDECSGIKWF
jgi:hypothetical protein